MLYVFLDGNGFVKVIQDVLGKIFDTVLRPVLQDAFNIVVNLIGGMLQSLLATWLLKILVLALKLIHFIEGIFNAFAGISNVKVRDVSEGITLLDYFFHVEAVQKVFFGITGIAVVLAFMATLFAVLRSMADAPFENRHPLSTVMRNAVGAAVNFLIIPIACLFVLQMSTTAVRAINTTFNNGNANASLSDTLFITVAGPAAKSPKSENIARFSAGQKYEDMNAVNQCFDIKKINYTQAYISCFMLFFVMLASILAFIQRIFLILVLYLVSPFFVAMMPLDGGAKFKEWRDVFVAHVLSAFGPILIMKLYLMLVPILVSDRFVYTDNAVLAGIVKILLLVGGAFAVYKSRNIIVSIISFQAASTIAQSGIIASFIGGKMMGAVGKAGGKKGGGGGGKKPGGGASGSANKSIANMKASQAYKGKGK